ncbi:MAG: TonB-dependent receptor [Haliscomenobacter sp.]|uniref:SusC/RagA family TonB-linked outer membrane protein n=1 Tax=Haliscomenobacter sp. TaxID=2717303 RepID=UPI0029B5ECAE|nr:TonB-dependent receptor [Haliscomenobacter sp.]MDX2068591.1 TonB-dependent receptor [Haliscomenobacter sp.]
MKKLSLVFVLLLLGSAALWAQKNITGKVTDSNGEALIGASILVKGTVKGTITDIEGSFSLAIPEGSNVLQISYTGFKAQEVTLGTETTLTIIMETDAIGLDETVVVAYGTQSNRFRVQSIGTVTAENIKNVPLLGPQQLLQGQVAGVQMTNMSGVLGSAAAIRVRGPSSINAGGNPLFVIDGVPLNDRDYSAAQGAGAGLNPLNDINPNDIASMTVLKDAGATAIYGSRGANGVILITTKKGKAGTNTVNFDYFTGTSEPTFVLEMMNAQQYRDYRKAYANVTVPGEGGFDWPSAVRQTGRINNYTLNLSGGNDKTQYYLSGSFLNQSNYAIGNDLDRMNGRLNFNHTFSDKFRFGANIGISRIVNDRIGSDNNTFAPLTSAFLQLPTVQPYDAAGNYVNTGFITNVLALEALGTNQLVTNRTYANTYFKLDVLPGLFVQSDWGIDLVDIQETTRQANVNTPGGLASNRLSDDNKWLTTNTLNLERQFGDLALGAVAGFSFETALYDFTYVEGRNFSSDALRNVSSAATPTSTQNNRSQWALNSQFVRTNFRYKDRYIVEGSVRRDGSSRFGSENRYGTFWAVSGGWVVSEEQFMKGLGFLNQLKLTASYGLNGNDRIGDFPSLGLFGSGVLSDYSGGAGLRPTQIANPDLKWETTTQLDLGISIAILNNRVSLDVNYYNKKTSDLLLDIPLPLLNGFASITRNAGEMENRGVDINLNTVNIKTKKFEWKTNFNIGFLENEVLSLPDASKDLEGRQFVGGTLQRAIVGHSINTFFMVPYKGINPDNGNAEWIARDGSIINTVNPNERQIVGDAIPDFTGGFSNTFNYNGFDFNVFFNFTYGNSIYLGDLTFTENPIGGFNYARRVADYWTESNRDAAFPAATSATRNVFSQASTLHLLDGSFIRLRNISLGYTLKGSQLKTEAFQNVRLYVMGQNLWTLRAKGWEGRGQDPEIADAGNANLRQGQSFFTPPQAKMITGGLNITF